MTIRRKNLLISSVRDRYTQSGVLTDPTGIDLRAKSGYQKKFSDVFGLVGTSFHGRDV
jgi:hypothetical protein